MPLKSQKTNSALDDECILLESDSEYVNNSGDSASKTKGNVTQKNKVKGESTVRESNKRSKLTENVSESSSLEVPNGIIDSD